MGLADGKLYLSNDRKTKMYPTQENSFGLYPGPAHVGGTCPFATGHPGGCFYVKPGGKLPPCYAYNNCQVYRTAGEHLRENTTLVQNAVRWQDKARLLQEAVERFHAKTLAYAKSKKMTKAETRKLLRFRVHWSGDFFSKSYARAFAAVIRAYPDVTFWAYTRSFRFLEPLYALENLVLYLSLDNANWEKGVCEFFRYGFDRDFGKTRKIAYMSKKEEDLQRMMAEMRSRPERYCRDDPSRVLQWLDSTRISRCPVDLGKMKLEYGCKNCRQCLTAGNQLLFFKC